MKRVARYSFTEEFKKEAIKLINSLMARLRFPLFFVFQWVNSFMLSAFPSVERLVSHLETALVIYNPTLSAAVSGCRVPRCTRSFLKLLNQLSVGALSQRLRAIVKSESSIEDPRDSFPHFNGVGVLLMINLNYYTTSHDTCNTEHSADRLEIDRVENCIVTVFAVLE